MKKYLMLLLIVIYSTTYAEDFWVKTNGPFGADINSIMIDINTDDIFLATKSDGVYISTDDGNSWESTNDGVLKSRTWINDVLLDNKILYVTTDSLGILKKLPYQNWKAINSGMGGFLSFNKIIKLDNNVFIAGSNGKAIFKTTNSGENWYNLNTGLNSDEDVKSLLKLDNNSILLGSENGIFLSTNDGKSWVNKKNDIGNVYKIIKRTNKVYLASDSGVFISSDNGENWTESNSGFEELSQVISIAANNTSLFAVVKEKGIFQSALEEINWTSMNNGLNTLKIKTIEINKNTNEVVAGSNEAFYKYDTDSDKWLANNNGLGLRTINSLINSGDVSILAGTDIGIYESNNNGYSWSSKNNGLDGFLNINCLLKVNDSLFIAGTKGDGLYLAKRDMVWQKINNPDFTSTIVNTLNMDSSGFIYAGTEGKGVFKSEDKGANWYQMFGNEINNAIISSMVITTDNTIYTGTKNKGLYKKTEVGQWRNIDNLGYSITEVSALNISVDSSDNMTIYVGTNLGLKKSPDGGNNWFDANGFYPKNLPGKINTIYYDINNTLYCGLKNINGVYSSTNTGEDWIRILDKSGIINYKIKSFTMSTNGYLYAGSQNGGSFRSYIKIFGDTKETNRPKLNLIGDSSFCKGGYSIIDGGIGYLSYYWSNGHTARFDTVFASGTYWVRVKDSLQIELVSDSIKILVNDIPSKPNIFYNGEKFVCTSQEASYQWYFNNDIIPNATEKEYTPLKDGWYKCEITSEYNCKNISDSVEYKKPVSAVDEKILEPQINVFPNPSSGKFILKIDNIRNEKARIVISDLLGNDILFKNVILTNNDEIRIQQNFSPGIYLLRIEFNKLILYKKLIVNN